MQPIPHTFVVVALDGRRARVWAHGVEPGTAPVVVTAQDHRDKHRHVRGRQTNEGQVNPTDEADYFDRITTFISEAGEILLVGHGHGTSDATRAFRMFLDHRHRGLSTRVAGSIEVDLKALTDAQLLATARLWFDTHERP